MTSITIPMQEIADPNSDIQELCEAIQKQMYADIRPILTQSMQGHSLDLRPYFIRLNQILYATILSMQLSFDQLTEQSPESRLCTPEDFMSQFHQLLNTMTADWEDRIEPPDPSKSSPSLH